MASLTEIHLDLQERLRGAVAAAVAAVWNGLPGHDSENVDEWLSTVLPIVLAAQERSVALTDAYVARALERPALGLDTASLVGAAVRNGADPEEVYHRPFVAVWAALGRGVLFEDALARGLHRATSTAATDVQLSHRASYGALMDADSNIRGYRRAANGSACRFCRTVAGAFVKSPTAMPLHSHCGCGLVPLEYDIDVSPVPKTVAVRRHGELGEVLGDPAHHFQGPDF